MKRLYRSRSNVIIAGVCGGLADYIGIDPLLVRVIFLLLLLAALGGFWLYIIFWIIMPVQPADGIESVEVKAKTKAEKPLELAVPEKSSEDKVKSEK